MYTIHTNIEEKKQYSKILTKALKKQFPFILDVSVDQLSVSHSLFDIDCLIHVPKDFILENVNPNYDGGMVSSSEIKKYINKGIMPTFAFNAASKKIKFNTEEFLKLARLLFHSMFGKYSEYSRYSIEFSFEK